MCYMGNRVWEVMTPLNPGICENISSNDIEQSGAWRPGLYGGSGRGRIRRVC